MKNTRTIFFDDNKSRKVKSKKQLKTSTLVFDNRLKK